MLNAKRLMSIVLVLAMVVTMASFPVSAATSAPANLTLVSAANPQNTTKYGGDKAIDGDVSTYYATSGYIGSAGPSSTPYKLKFDLGDLSTITSIVLKWGASAWGYMLPESYNLYVSADDAEYTPVASYTGLLTADNRYDGKVVVTAGSKGGGTLRATVTEDNLNLENARYLMIEITGWQYRAALAEVEVMIAGDPAPYTVEYVDEDGEPIADVKTVDGLHGATVTETAPDFEGYKLVGDATASITLDKDATNKITFTYKKLAAVEYTVNYVDEDGKAIADAAVKSSYDTLTATETAIDVLGYELIGEKTASIVLDAAADNTITFVYKKLPSLQYTVKYVDENGSAVAPEKVAEAIFPYEVTETAVYVDGYYKPATVTKTLSETDKVIEFVYEAVPERMVSTVDNLLKNAKVSASSSYKTSSTTWGPENAIDNNGTTYWQSNAWTSGNPNDVYTIDLGDTYDISDMSIRWLCTGNSSMLWVGGGAARPSKYTIEVSTDGTNYTPVYTYDNPNRYEASDVITIADFDVTPRDVRYVRIKNTKNIAGCRAGIYEVKVNGYVVCDRVMSAPELGLYAEGSTAVGFPFTVMTVDNVDPIAYFDAANWVLENCTVEVTTENVSNPASVYYTWNVDVKVIPTDAHAPISMYLDLPDSYKMTDAFSYYLEPSDLLFDSAIAAGQNAIILSKSDFVLNYKEDGTLTDDSANVANRSITMMLQVQSVIEDGLPYEGYDEIVIELKEFKSKGDRVRFYLDEFVRSGDYYLASLLVTKAGVDQLEAVIGIYGVKADGTKVELDTRTITSELINIEAKYPVAKTRAQTVKDFTYPMDVLDQLIGYVHPADLPTYSDDEWAFFREILIARGWKKDDGDEAKGIPDSATKEINRVRTLLENELAKLEDPNWVPDKEYADGHVAIQNGYYNANTSDYKRIIRMGTEVWNLLTSLHVDSFSVYGPIERPSAKQQETGYENDIVDAYVTFREGIDYNYGEKWTENDGFCIRMKFVGTSAEYANITLGNAYNSVRRALKDDQVSPVLFRLDWYNWAKNPFNGGVITVELTEDWVENYGLFNLATYHMKGYKYSEDNDPELTLMEDGIAISNPFVREVSVTIEGAAAMYDTYVIVSTNKLPSELPEQIGVYYDVE